MKREQRIKQLVSMMIFATTALHAIDNPHFWRATNFLPEFYQTRLSKPWLASFDVSLGYGSTDKSRNQFGQKTTLLNIYGPQNAQALGVNVPGKDLTTPGDIVLTQLALLPSNDGFGMLQYNGKFRLIEANVCYSQNLDCGFFLQVHAPIRNYSVTDITFTDLSPLACGGGPNVNTPSWQNFLALFPTILTQYGISTGSVHHSGIGDISTLVGWTNNYEDTTEIDFFDTTIRLGVLFPTGAKLNPHQAFDIANGYDGHFAIPVCVDAAAGWYDWFTMGAHLGAMPFFKQTRNLPLKTDAAQNGFIKLARGDARIQPGTIWEANFYTLADHVICGFSLLVGYSYATKRPDMILPCDTTTFSPAIVNNDGPFLGWKMHTVNIMAEWDFASYECPWYPRIGAFYNFIVGGERIFNTNMGGVQCGIDIGCTF